jgi:hypothetical protein
MTEKTGNGWAGLVRSYGVSDATATRLIRSLVASEVAALAFCRLLDRWARGEPEPCTAGRRQAALRRAAERAETALTGLERPLGRFLLELEPDGAEGRSWYGEPGAGELLDWEPVLSRAGVRASPARVDRSRADRRRRRGACHAAARSRTDCGAGCGRARGIRAASVPCGDVPAGVQPGPRAPAPRAWPGRVRVPRGRGGACARRRRGWIGVATWLLLGAWRRGPRPACAARSRAAPPP